MGIGIVKITKSKEIFLFEIYKNDGKGLECFFGLLTKGVAYAIIRMLKYAKNKKEKYL